MNTIATSINRPEIGFDHLLVFKTCKEAIDENGEPYKNTIKRRTQIVYTGIKGELYGYQIFLLETECMFHYTLDPYSLLIRRLTYVFDECFVGVTQNGTIEKVFNTTFIQYRWKQIRSKLIMEHEGEIFDQYVEEMEARVKNHDSILEYLKQQSMYGLYFNGYWNIELTNNFNNVNYNVEVYAVPSQIADGLVLEVTGNTMDGDRHLAVTGKYKYINRILSEAESITTIESAKTKHSVSWVGLRKRL